MIAKNCQKLPKLPKLPNDCQKYLELRDFGKYWYILIARDVIYLFMSIIFGINIKKPGFYVDL